MSKLQQELNFLKLISERKPASQSGAISAEARRDGADLWMWFTMGPDLTLQSIGRGKLKIYIKHWDDLHCKWMFRDVHRFIWQFMKLLVKRHFQV